MVLIFLVVKLMKDTGPGTDGREQRAERGCSLPKRRNHAKWQKK
jgi:hypothetical protein